MSQVLGGRTMSAVIRKLGATILTRENDLLLESVRLRFMSAPAYGPTNRICHGQRAKEQKPLTIDSTPHVRWKTKEKKRSVRDLLLVVYHVSEIQASVLLAGHFQEIVRGFTGAFCENLRSAFARGDTQSRDPRLAFGRSGEGGKRENAKVLVVFLVGGASACRLALAYDAYIMTSCWQGRLTQNSAAGSRCS